MKRRGGFTLIEMVAVLAILAILAGAIVPTVSQSIRDARADAERRTLETIAQLVRDQVRRNGNVPSAASWAASLALLSELPVARLARNPDGWNRAYIPDPAWTPVSTRPVLAGGWTQTPAVADLVAAAPANARILVISDLNADAQTACQNMTAVQFSAVWDETAGAPAACVATQVRALVRINLTTEFVQVVRNVSAPLGPPAPGWTFGGNAAAAVPFAAAGTTTRWHLRGSRLGLVSGGTVAGEIVLRDPVSVTWDGIAWKGF
ncbi:MAG: type II secretion system protein [Fibrobacterota bacterium]|nr:type II secretion system protein [Fibrobacterota bacterium]QQS07401.1 MAG: type II secretion system protein [Fibrobacterota bacterium]